MVTSDATSRLHIQCHQQGSVEWIEKAIAAVSRSSFWDSANFLAICLELPVWTRRELMSSLSLSGDLWGWCSAPGATQGLTDMDESLSGGQVLSTSCFYGLLKAESDVGRPSWLALWYCLCHSVWWCCCVQALQTMEDWEIKTQTFLIVLSLFGVCNLWNLWRYTGTTWRKEIMTSIPKLLDAFDNLTYHFRYWGCQTHLEVQTNILNIFNTLPFSLTHHI